MHDHVIVSGARLIGLYIPFWKMVSGSLSEQVEGVVKSTFRGTGGNPRSKSLQPSMAPSQAYFNNRMLLPKRSCENKGEGNLDGSRTLFSILKEVDRLTKLRKDDKIDL